VYATVTHLARLPVLRQAVSPHCRDVAAYQFETHFVVNFPNQLNIRTCSSPAVDLLDTHDEEAATAMM
jgi:hypothetical protein